MAFEFYEPSSLKKHEWNVELLKKVKYEGIIETLLAKDDLEGTAVITRQGCRVNNAVRSVRITKPACTNNRVNNGPRIIKINKQ